MFLFAYFGVRFDLVEKNGFVGVETIAVTFEIIIIHLAEIHIVIDVVFLFFAFSWDNYQDRKNDRNQRRKLVIPIKY